MEILKPSIAKLATDLTEVKSLYLQDESRLGSMNRAQAHLLWHFLQIKQNHDGEKKQLSQLRDVLKASLQSENREVRSVTSVFSCGGRNKGGSRGSPYSVVAHDSRCSGDCRILSAALEKKLLFSPLELPWMVLSSDLSLGVGS